MIRQVLRPFRGNDIRTALRTLIANYPTHGRFLQFCFLKLPARHANAVTRGTQKNRCEHRQAAGSARFKARDEASQGEKNAKVGIQSFGPKPQHRMRKM